MAMVVGIVRRRAAALVRSFHRKIVPPPAAVDDLDAAAATIAWGGGTVEALPGYEGRAFVWRWPEADASSVWASRQEPHRDIFRRFVETVYGAVDWTGFGSYDVDHLFNRARAPEARLLRLEAIDARVNHQHGAGFERRNTSSTIEVATMGRDRRKLTFMSALKLAGLPPPRSMADAERLRPVRDYFIRHGWALGEIDDAIETLLTKANWRR